MVRSPEPGLGSRLAVFAAYDLLVSVAMIGTWYFTGLLDPWLGAATVLVRIAVWFGYFGSRLRPLRTLQRDPERASEARLLAADAELQALTRRMARLYSASWLVTELLWFVVMLYDVPVAIPNGRAELFAGLMFAAAAPSLGHVGQLILDAAFIPIHRSFGQMLAALDLRPTRTPSSFVRPIVTMAIWLLPSTSLVLGGGAIVWGAHAQRQHSVEFERAHVELSSSRIDAGEAMPRGAELLAIEDLSSADASALAGAGFDLPALEPSEPVAVHDLERGETVAVMALGDARVLVTRAVLEDRLTLLFGIILLLGLVCGPLCAVAVWLFGRMLSAPLEDLSNTAERFVETGDLSEFGQLVPLRNDEFGRLTSSFNAMLGLLSELTAAATAVSAGNLRVELSRPGPLHDAFRGMLVRLNDSVGHLRETSLELASATAEINALVGEQEQASQVQSGNLHEVALMVRSLSEAAAQIATATKDVREDAERAVATTDASAVQSTALSTHTASIAELLVLIGEIADRSDLLALNGSLEATRAGEAGRGFALVAAEMRRLAERVSGTVSDVRAQVRNVESSTAETVAATDRSRALATRTAVAARVIDSLSVAQNTDTERASLGVEAVANAASEASLAVTQIRAATKGLHIQAIELEHMLGNFELRDEHKGRQAREH